MLQMPNSKARNYLIKSAIVIWKPYISKENSYCKYHTGYYYIDYTLLYLQTTGRVEETIQYSQGKQKQEVPPESKLTNFQFCWSPRLLKQSKKNSFQLAIQLKEQVQLAYLGECTIASLESFQASYNSQLSCTEHKTHIRPLQ